MTSSYFDHDFFPNNDDFPTSYEDGMNNFKAMAILGFVLTVVLPILFCLCCGGFGYCIWRRYQQDKKREAEEHNPDKLPAFPSAGPNNAQHDMLSTPASGNTAYSSHGLVIPAAFPVVAQEPAVVPLGAYPVIDEVDIEVGKDQPPKSIPSVATLQQV